MFSFPAASRIKKKKHFARMELDGTTLFSRCFLVVVAPAPGPVSRLGVTVTKKVDKRATVRNRIKRRIREVFRLNRSKLKEPCDIVVIARKGAGACDRKEAERQILGALYHNHYLS